MGYVWLESEMLCYALVLGFVRDVDMFTRGVQLYRDSPNRLMSLAGIWPLLDHGEMPDTGRQWKYRGEDDLVEVQVQSGQNSTLRSTCLPRPPFL